MADTNISFSTVPQLSTFLQEGTVEQLTGGKTWSFKGTKIKIEGMSGRRDQKPGLNSPIRIRLELTWFQRLLSSCFASSSSSYKAKLAEAKSTIHTWAEGRLGDVRDLIALRESITGIVADAIDAADVVEAAAAAAVDAAATAAAAADTVDAEPIPKRTLQERSEQTIREFKNSAMLWQATTSLEPSTASLYAKTRLEVCRALIGDLESKMAGDGTRVAVDKQRKSANNFQQLVSYCGKTPPFQMCDVQALFAAGEFHDSTFTNAKDRLTEMIQMNVLNEDWMMEMESICDRLTQSTAGLRACIYVLKHVDKRGIEDVGTNVPGPDIALAKDFATQLEERMTASNLNVDDVGQSNPRTGTWVEIAVAHLKEDELFAALDTLTAEIRAGKDAKTGPNDPSTSKKVEIASYFFDQCAEILQTVVAPNVDRAQITDVTDKARILQEAKVGKKKALLYFRRPITDIRS